jgi:signal transduction histidine kinase
MESQNIYLMMTDKDGNLIRKSKNLEILIKESNIFKLNEPKLTEVIQLIKPTNNTSLSKIYFIENDPIFHEKSVVAVYTLPRTHWNIIIGIPKDKVMAQSNQTFKNVLTIIIILTFLATLLGYLLLKKLFANPMESLNEQLKTSSLEDGKHYKLLECKDRGEIGLLVDNLNNRSIALDEAQEREAIEIKKRVQNEKMLIQQSKMAAMGEMMDAVAHQWKQPLNALSMYSEIIKSDFDDGSVDEKYIDQFKDDVQVQIDHMVNTLDEFRTFFRPNKEHETFSLINIIDSVLFLTKDDLLKNRITVNIEQKDQIDIDGSSNEFKHLVLNIINNAKDAFNDNNIEKRKINIRLINNKDGKKMEIEDNAGGIPEHIIDDIFKANVTSKAEGKGTGIGLYMSTQIANKHHAALTVKNQNDGACFTVKFS